jgi:hypothetical protein
MTDQLEILYESEYSLVETYIIDFDLMCSGQLLVVIVEDCKNNCRELSCVQIKTGELICPPVVSLITDALFSVRAVFKNHLLVAGRSYIYSFEFDPEEKLFRARNNLRALPKNLEWIQLETWEDRVYVFTKTN